MVFGFDALMQLLFRAHDLKVKFMGHDEGIRCLVVYGMSGVIIIFPNDRG